MIKRSVITIFLALVGIFILMLIYFAIPFTHEIKRALFPYVAIIGFIFFFLGGLLIYYTYKLKLKGRLKLFLILTGLAPIVFLVSVVLHNFVYGLFIYLFGEGFWNGGDEAFFFILALIVCPIVFLIGVVGSMVLFIKERKKDKKYS